MTEALRFWALIEVIGLGAAPLAGVALARLPGAGLGLRKVLGLLLVTWLVWIGGLARRSRTARRARRSGSRCALGCCSCAAGGARRGGAAGSPRAGALWRVPEPDPLRTRLFWGAEAVFARRLRRRWRCSSPTRPTSGTPRSRWTWRSSTPPDRADSFPPDDPWLAGEDLNYYYLGHLMAAGSSSSRAVAPDDGYNLAVAALFALTAAAVFTLVGGAGRRALAARRCGASRCASWRARSARGLELIDDGGPLRDYDWFAASRVIEDTINEFPWFSFLLGDLHAHVLAIPFTLLALAFALQVVLDGPADGRRGAGRARAGAAPRSRSGSLYAINAWSYPVIAGLLAARALVRVRDAPQRARAPADADVGRRRAAARRSLAVLPFLLDFDPAADGLGRVDERAPFARLGARPGALFGAARCASSATAYGGRLASPAPPVAQRRRGSAAAAVVRRLAARRARLTARRGARSRSLGGGRTRRSSAPAPGAERFVWLLVGGGLACLLSPELLYVSDEFDGSASIA